VIGRTGYSLADIDRREGGAERGQTRGKTLLQLLRLLSVVEDEGVQVAVAADLELDGVRAFGWLLRSHGKVSVLFPFSLFSLFRRY